MPINDDAQRLLDLATNTAAAAGVRQAVEQVTSSREIACGAAGQGSDDARELFDVSAAAIEQCQAAIAAIQLFYDTCAIVAARHL